MLKILTILISLATWASGQYEGVVRVGIQASSQSLVDATYGPIFTQKFAGFNYSVNSTALITDAAVYAAIEQNAFDVFYGGPTIFNCLQSQYGLRGIAAAIDQENGQDTPYLGAAMVARKTSMIRNISQVSGSRIAVTQLTHTVGCLAQWGEMRKNGLDLFVDSSAVILANTSANVLQAVATGVVDVGFLRSGTVEQEIQAGLYTNDTFQVVNQLDEDFPWPVSTSLYPAVVIAVTKLVDDDLASRFAQALFERDNLSQQANISRWVPLQDYVPLQTLQLMLGVMYPDLSQCYRVSTYYDSIVCPNGYLKADKAKLETSCNGILQCAGDLYTCICGPCVRVSLNQNRRKWLLLLVLAPTFVMLWCLFVFVQRRRHQISRFQLSDLNLEVEATRKNNYGDVWSGNYKGASVELKSVKASCRPLEKSSSRLCKCIPRNDCIVYLTGGHTHTELMLRQVQDMAQLRHPCVLQGVGAAVKEGQVMLISLTSSNGSLKDLLHNPTVEIEKGMMISLLYDIARGLDYLESQEYKIESADCGTESIHLDDDFRAMLELDSVGKTGCDTHAYPVAFGKIMLDMVYRRQRCLSLSEPAGLTFRNFDIKNSADDSGITTTLQDCLSGDASTRPSMKNIVATLQRQSDRLFRDKFNPLKIRNILRQMLPVDVINDIKSNRMPAQQTYENVSICIVDISHRALDISNSAELREIQSSVRSICETLSTRMCLMTLKPLSEDTRFVAVGNLMSPLHNHASIIIDFALEALRKISRTAMRNNQSFLKAQAGIHIGRVKSCILGREEARYSLLGKDIVVTSELQLQSEPDHLLVSTAAANQALLMKRKPPFNFFSSAIGRKSAIAKEFNSVWLCAIGSQSQLSGSAIVRQ